MIQHRRPQATQIDRRRSRPNKPGRLQDSPLTWLHKRCDKAGKPWLDRNQYEAGQRLAMDFQAAQLNPSVTMNWNALAARLDNDRANYPGRLEPGERAAAAAGRFPSAIDAVGPELAGILIDVCCFEKGLEGLEKQAGWPTRSAKVILQLALDRLAAHYGLVSSTTGPARSVIKHWGTADYRPTIDGRKRNDNPDHQSHTEVPPRA